MTRNTGTDRKSTTARTVAKVAIAGLVVGAPLAMFAGPASAAASGNNWDAVAQCESGGNWSTSTGNGFSGGLQFTPSTWAANGGQGSAQNASKAQQIQVAESVLATQGAGAWPVCGKALSSSAPSSSSSTSTTSKATTYSAPKQQAPAESYSAPKQQAPAKSYSAPKQQATSYSAPRSTPGGTYIVQSGDTLSTIAAANNVAGGYQTIAAANPGTITDVNLIFPGQALKLG